MPPGNTVSRPPVKVVERTSIQACLAIAQRVQQDRQLAGDEAGSAAARQVAKDIEAELLASAGRPPA